MEGSRRREEIIDILKAGECPVSGTELAKKLGVSRQIIVQDIALLRATDKNIISTNKGYIYFMPDEDRQTRVYCVNHDDEHIEDELNTIVDNGGKIMDVIVEHDVYGTITADLQISNRRDVTDFMEKMGKCKSRPLNIITDGTHYHTVTAQSAEVLDNIEKDLAEKGYLI